MRWVQVAALVVAALGGTPRLGHAAYLDPIVIRARDVAELLDQGGAPAESIDVVGPRGPAALAALDSVVTALDRYLKDHPSDDTALVARGRLARLLSRYSILRQIAQFQAEPPEPRPGRAPDPRDSIEVWFARARAANPQSAEPPFWSAVLWSDPSYVMISRIYEEPLRLELARAVGTVREALRIDPGRRYARAWLEADLAALAEEDWADSTATGTPESDRARVQIDRLQSDRAWMVVPNWSMPVPLMGGIFRRELVVAPEDASPEVSAARTRCYVAPTDPEAVIEFFVAEYPGLDFTPIPPELIVAAQGRWSRAFAARLRWTTGVRLAPAVWSLSSGPQVSDAVDVLVAWSDSFVLAPGMTGSSEAATIPAGVLFALVNRRRLDP